jgi:methyl-accepting chemotaxis protein
LETPLKSLKGADLIAKSSKIYFKDSVISEILIVMSREKLKKQVLFQIYGTIALLILIIAAIWLTSIFITRRYISSPLLKLQESASLIARGDLDTFVDKSSGRSSGYSPNFVRARGNWKSTAEPWNRRSKCAPANWRGQWKSSKLSGRSARWSALPLTWRWC